MPERRVVIDRSPPRRLLDTLRFRSFKLGPDIQVWEQCYAPVDALIAEGWRITDVLIEWGKSLPLTPYAREQAARELTRCMGDCMIRETSGKPGRGTTTITLERDA